MYLQIFCMLCLFLLPGCRDDRETIVVYNWGEYIANEDDTIEWFGQEYTISNVIKAFEDEYPQYRVRYLTYDDNEKMYP